MRLGIFGGTFNPPHLGHLIVAESVREQLQLDKVLFVPSATPPHKHYPSLAPAQMRLQMTSVAVQENRGFEASAIEVERGGTSYSVDTLDQLRKEHPKASLFLLIGSDNLLEFESWKSPLEILEKADLVVMTRPGFRMEESKNEFARRAVFVNVPAIGISGTDIRRRVKLGRSIRYLVPPAIEEIILRRHLYRD